jgi:hypothetical protein
MRKLLLKARMSKNTFLLTDLIILFLIERKYFIDVGLLEAVEIYMIKQVYPINIKNMMNKFIKPVLKEPIKPPLYIFL